MSEPAFPVPAIDPDLLADPEVSELCVVGSLLLDDQLLPDVLRVIQPGDFRVRAYRDVVLAMIALYEDQRAFEPVSVFRELQRRGVNFDPKALATWAEAVPSPGHGVHYARQVRAAAHKRELQFTVAELRRMVDENDMGVIEQARQLMEVAASGSDTSMGHLSEYTDAALEIINTPIDLEGGEDGFLPWGIAELDARGAYLRPADFVIVAASPGVGKSWFTQQWALDISMRRGCVLFCSLEMPPAEVAHRALLMAARVRDPLQDVPSPAAKEKLIAAREDIGGSALFAPDHIPRDVDKLVLWLRSWIHANKPVAVVLDYLGLVRGKGNGKVEQTTDVSTKLRAVAKDTGVPLIAIHSLNRKAEVEKRPPEKSDLRDSGQIEFDATQIILLHRPWNILSDAQKSQSEQTVNDLEITLRSVKRRGGPDYVEVAMIAHPTTSRIQPISKRLQAIASGGAERRVSKDD